MALFLSASAGECLAQTNITEFPLTRTIPIYPAGIVFSSTTSNYWFTELDGGAIGAIDTVSNLITEVLLTNNSGANPLSITDTHDGYLWFTEGSDNRLGRMNPATSNYVEFQLTNNVPRRPAIIVLGPDGNLWFTEEGQNKIAAVSPSGITNSYGHLPILQESPTIRTNTQLFGLTAGPDGNLWFAEATPAVIGRYSIASNTFTEFPLANTNATPFAITVGPDGALWFTEYGSNAVGRITVDGHITEYALPLLPGYAFPSPLGIITGPDGNLWFCEYNGSAIGRITPQGIVTLFPTPTVNSFPVYLATGADSNIWFTEYSSDGNTVVQDHLARLIVVPGTISLTAQADVTAPGGLLTNGYLGVYQSSSPSNTVVINWGDGTQTTPNLYVVGLATNYVVKVLGNHIFTGSSNYHGSLTITDLANNDTAYAPIIFQASSLGIFGAGPNVMLYWPSNFTNVTLYQNSNLLTTNWTKVTNAPVVITNGQHRITLPTTASPYEFYRLQ